MMYFIKNENNIGKNLKNMDYIYIICSIIVFIITIEV